MSEGRRTFGAARRNGGARSSRLVSWRAPDAGPDWRAAAERALGDATASGAARYDRRRTLPRLIAFDIRELERPGPELDRRILARLKRALRAERSRGRAGGWTYDLNRHLALLQALAGEAARSTAGAAEQSSPETKSAARRIGRREREIRAG